MAVKAFKQKRILLWKQRNNNGETSTNFRTIFFFCCISIVIKKITGNSNVSMFFFYFATHDFCGPFFRSCENFSAATNESIKMLLFKCMSHVIMHTKKNMYTRAVRVLLPIIQFRLILCIQSKLWALFLNRIMLFLI